MHRSLVAMLLLLIVSGGSVALFAWPGAAPRANEPASHRTAHSAPPSIEMVRSQQPLFATNSPPTSTPVPTPGVAVVESGVETAVPPTAEVETPETATPAASPQPVWTRAEPAPRAPTRLYIPGVQVDARITGVGTTSEGHMADPDDFAEVGWYEPGVAPGRQGRAVMAGHVDSLDGPAVFYHLRDLTPGMEIAVELGDSSTVVYFVVQETAQYPAADAPLDRIFGPSEHAELILITCGGNFDRATGTYDDRFVVYATLKPAG